MLIFAERWRKSMSKLHVCIDETWLFKVVEGNVFDRFLSNPHYFRLLYPHCALKTRRKKPNQLIVEKAQIYAEYAKICLDSKAAVQLRSWIYPVQMESKPWWGSCSRISVLPPYTQAKHQLLTGAWSGFGHQLPDQSHQWMEAGSDGIQGVPESDVW